MINAWPERGTNAAKRIKTKMKSTIKIALLNSLLISLIAQSNEKKVQMIKINAESGRTYEYMNQKQK